MPTGNLPEEGKKLFERVYQESLKGSCNDDKGCAASIAWTAVKNAGWKKNADGVWEKKSLEVQEFSLYISKAFFDKPTGEMRWQAVASDTAADSYNDSMSHPLFNDFISRIKSNEQPPIEFRSEFWQGGMPYVSLSHYLDLNGKAVPGIVDALYVDGNALKARGKFLDTPLGRACFKSICKDLSVEKSEQPPVRISIAFLDFKHIHKSNGYVFDRPNLEDVCIECAKELAQKQKSGKIFEKGLLIHLAMTRIPVNKRTSMTLEEKSMATRSEDALSIVGDPEIVAEIEKESQLVGKSEALVIKADEEVEKAKTKGGDPASMPSDMEDATDMPADCKDGKCGVCKACKDKKQNMMKSDIEEIKSMLVKVLEMKSDTVSVVAHPLDAVLNSFKSQYDAVLSKSISAEDKLRELQEPYAMIGKSLQEMIKDVNIPVEKVETVANANEMVQAFSEALAPLTQKLDLMLTMQKSAVQAPVVATDVPARRSISPSLVAQSLAAPSAAPRSATPKLRALIERTTR